MRQNDVMAINSDLMTNKVTDINNKITSINTNLSKIKELANSNDFGLVGDLEVDINSKFELITDKFSTVINNLEIIVSELVACQGNYNFNDEDVATILRGKSISEGEVK